MNFGGVALLAMGFACAFRQFGQFSQTTALKTKVNPKQSIRLGF